MGTLQGLRVHLCIQGVCLGFLLSLVQTLMCRKSDSSRSDLAPNGHSERPWSNLSSALQPSVSPAVTNTEPVTTAQLQSIAASRMKKNGDHRDEAVVSISEANVEQWLSQLAEAPGEAPMNRQMHAHATAACLSTPASSSTPPPTLIAEVSVSNSTISCSLIHGRKGHKGITYSMHRSFHDFGISPVYISASLGRSV